jgi:Tfp pilus assembly pilus retraction ATPase PilT
MNAPQLTPLAAEQWPQVRDILIPLTRETGSDDAVASFQVNADQMRTALAYTGALKPQLLYDHGNPASMIRFVELFNQSLSHLEQGRDKFRIEAGDTKFRAQLAMTTEGPMLALRALPAEVPSLDDLRMPQTWRVLLNDAELLNGGLVLVVAPNGQGKTTTCSATVKTRLATWDGVALAIEDPPELPLAGFHGAGRCLQIPADLDDGDMPGSGYAKALLKTLRLFPSLPSGGTMLFVGEIRDPKTAAETLLAAANGHLVIATLHAQNIPTALMRLSTLATATDDRMSDSAVQQMLAEVLRGVIYQKLTYVAGGTGWSRGNLRGQILWVGKQDTKLSDAVRAGSWSDIARRAEAQTRAVDNLEAALQAGGKESSDLQAGSAKSIRETLAKAP